MSLTISRLLPPLAGLVFWTFTSTLASAEYKYPIGIPKAWIDPDVAAPARPVDWRSEAPGYYFVDSSSGTDKGRTFGTPDAPRKSIPKPIPPGSRVEVNGLYGESTGEWFITFAGSAGPWVANASGPGWLTGASQKRASFAGSVFYVGEYGCIDFVDNFGGYSVTNISSPTSGKGRKAKHMLLRNSEFKGMGDAARSSGFVINGNSDVEGRSENIVFYNNEVHGFGKSTPDGSDPDFIACYVSNMAKNIWILDNKLHDMSGSAIQMGGNHGDTPNISHVFAGRNQCYNLWGTGMAAKTSEYIVFSQNHIYNVMDNGSVSPSKGMSGQYAATNQWMIYNHIHDCAYGILRISGNPNVLESIYILGNVIHDIKPAGIDFTPGAYSSAGIGLWGTDLSYVINNTLYNVPQGLVMPRAGLIYVENNIIAELNQPTGFHFFSESSGFQKDIQLNNNLFWQDNGNVKIGIPGEPVMNVPILNASKYGKNNLVGHPKFVDVANWDFSIRTESPAEGSGLDPKNLEMNVFAKYVRDFGMDISSGPRQSLQVQGDRWSIGAIDFNPNSNSDDSGNVLLSSPTRLKAMPTTRSK